MARGESSASEPASQLVRRDVRAMNTDIELVCTGGGAERRLERAAKWLDAYEARFSRFKSTSELSALNASAGEPFVASPQLFRLVELSLELARRSDGLFDPTILRALEAAGYDRSFEQFPLTGSPNVAAQGNLGIRTSAYPRVGLESGLTLWSGIKREGRAGAGPGPETDIRRLAGHLMFTLAFGG